MPKPSLPVHGTSDWCHTEAPKEITKILLRSGYESGYYSQIFNNFLDACETWLDRLPTAFNQIAHGERLQDPPDIAGRWRRLEKKYKEQTLRHFADAFGVMFDATTDEEGNLTYADLFGGTFMEFVWKSEARYRGQFFTPWNVARMMAQMTMMGVDDELMRRLDAALEHSRTFQLGKLLGVEVSLETKLLLLDEVREHLKPVTVSDPACGSGIRLLAAASCMPRWAIDHRLVEFYGVDIDATCVKMATLNCRLYGLNGWRYELRSEAPDAAGATFSLPPNAMPKPAKVDMLDSGLIELPLFMCAHKSKV